MIKMKWMKVFLSVFLSFSVIFCCIGYAALTDSLTISGEAKAAPPPGIYIVDMELISSTGGRGNDTGTFTPLSTVVNTTIHTGSSYSSRYPTYTEVTYKITVWNNTGYKYAYAGTEYSSDVLNNSSIGNNFSIITKDNLGDSSATFNASDTVEPDGRITFYATYKISNYTYRNRDLQNMVRYKFGLHMDSVGDAAADKVIKQLGVILNNEETYQTLIERIDDKFNGQDLWTSNFIGNVWGSKNTEYSEDTETVNELFGAENLKITIGDEEVDVALLVKREDVDGNTNTGDDFTAGRLSSYGCEMTIYVTTGDLNIGDTPTVYAASYTCDQNADGSLGEWYLLGERYEGTATIVGYMGGAQYGGSFDTGTWRSVAATYKPSADYSYSVTRNQTIQNVIQASDRNAVVEMQSLIDDAVNVLTNSGYAGEAIVALQSVLDQATARCCASGTTTVNASSTRAQLVPLIKDIEYNLIPFADWLAAQN